LALIAEKVLAPVVRAFLSVQPATTRVGTARKTSSKTRRFRHPTCDIRRIAPALTGIRAMAIGLTRIARARNDALKSVDRIGCLEFADGDSMRYWETTETVRRKANRVSDIICPDQTTDGRSRAINAAVRRPALRPNRRHMG
jgi:hypothetical protein